MTSTHLKMHTAMALMATAVVGICLVLLSEWFAHYEPMKHLHLFNLFGIPGKAWFFGRREIVHLIGFIGCVLGGWSLIHSCSYKAIMWIHVPLAAVSIFTANWFYAVYPDLNWVQSVYPNLTKFGVLVGPVVYLFMGATLPIMYRFGSSDVRCGIERGMLVLIGALSVSLGCELVYEPLLRACDWSWSEHPITLEELSKAPKDFDWRRAWVQWCQVIVDVGSILFAFLICRQIRRRIAPAVNQASTAPSQQPSKGTNQ